MSKSFQDITIAAVDKERSHNIDGAFFRVYLQLSTAVPSAWAEIFDSVWCDTAYSMKRHAGIEGDALWIECVPEEMKADHLPELKRAVAASNSQYTDFLDKCAREQAREECRDQDHKNRLDGLDDLDFN